jgi:uncharacterized protein
MNQSEARPPFPPFSLEDAVIKTLKAEDAWNNKNPEAIALAYTVDSSWRNRSKFINGRTAIIEFLTGKWERELEYRLIKEVWCVKDNRIAVRFAYEWHDTHGQWYRSYGNENWQFNEQGLMAFRHASINDLAITESERKFHWPLGPRPDDHPGLSGLGL